MKGDEVKRGVGGGGVEGQGEAHQQTDRGRDILIFPLTTAVSCANCFWVVTKALRR